MGIYLHLSIQPHRITPEEWQSVYEEVAVVLTGPIEFMGMESQSGETCTRTVFTRKVESGSAYTAVACRRGLRKPTDGRIVRDVLRCAALPQNHG